MRGKDLNKKASEFQLYFEKAAVEYFEERFTVGNVTKNTRKDIVQI